MRKCVKPRRLSILSGQEVKPKTPSQLKEELARDINNTDLMHDYARVLMDGSQLGEAREVCERAIGIEDAADLHLLLGRVHRRLGVREEAIREFDTARRMDPELLAAHYNRGRMALEDEDYPTALACFEEYLRQDPDDEYALFSRACTKHASGDVLGAIPDYEAAYKALPDFADLLLNYGMAFRDLGDLERARTLFERVVELDPGDRADVSTALVELADIETKGGNQSAALSLLQRAVQEDPTYLEARLKLQQLED